ncbi:hypothetical protein F4679DRAFT_556461, partial [Xylaria curta]
MANKSSSCLFFLSFLLILFFDSLVDLSWVEDEPADMAAMRSHDVEPAVAVTLPMVGTDASCGGIIGCMRSRRTEQL